MKRSSGASSRAFPAAPSVVFWGQAELKPHRTGYWLNNARAEAPEAFDLAVRAVCDAYAAATERHAAGIHTVSTDEKTSIQALEVNGSAPEL